MAPVALARANSVMFSVETDAEAFFCMADDRFEPLSRELAASFDGGDGCGFTNADVGEDLNGPAAPPLPVPPLLAPPLPPAAVAGGEVDMLPVAAVSMRLGTLPLPAMPMRAASGEEVRETASSAPPSAAAAPATVPAAVLLLLTLSPPELDERCGNTTGEYSDSCWDACDCSTVLSDDILAAELCEETGVGVGVLALETVWPPEGAMAMAAPEPEPLEGRPEEDAGYTCTATAWPAEKEDLRRGVAPTPSAMASARCATRRAVSAVGRASLASMTRPIRNAGPVEAEPADRLE